MDSLIEEASKLGKKGEIESTWIPIGMSIPIGAILSCAFELIKKPSNTYWIILVIAIIVLASLAIWLYSIRGEKQGNMDNIRKYINSITGCLDGYEINADFTNEKGQINWEIVYKECVKNNHSLHNKIPTVILFLLFPVLSMASTTSQIDNPEIPFLVILATFSSIIAIYTSIRVFKKDKKTEKEFRELIHKLNAQEEQISQYEALLKNHTIAFDKKSHANHRELFNRGKDLLLAGNTEAAINYFNKAILLNPKHYQYYEYRADAYDQLEETNLALDDYNTAISLTNKENYLRIIHKIAIIQNNMGNLIEAELNYAKALKIYEEQDDTQKVSIDNTEVINMLNDYGNLLLRLNKLSAAERTFSIAIDKCNQILDNDNAQELLAMTLNNISLLHKKLYQLDKAEDEVKQALKKYRILAANSPEKHLPDVAMSLNNLANIHTDTNSYAAAEEDYTEALSIRRQLAKADPDAFLPDVATTLNNLAALHVNTNNHAAAKKEYTEALSIRRKLAKDNPDAFLPDVAMTLNNLAILHRRTDNHTAAEEEYTEALRTYRSLAEANPDAFMPDVAMTLNNLAVLHRITNNHAAAEKEYTEALKILRSLAEANPDAFLPDVAMTLNNLAYLHADTDNHPAAEEEFTESLSIRRKLAEANPDAFLPRVADTLNNLANLHSDTNNHPAAEVEYTETLSIYRKLAEANPDAFLPDVAMTLFNIALLHLRKGELDEAERAAQESLDKFRTMAEKSHAAFDKDVQDAEKLLANIQKRRGAEDGTE